MNHSMQKNKQLNKKHEFGENRHYNIRRITAFMLTLMLALTPLEGLQIPLLDILQLGSAQVYADPAPYAYYGDTHIYATEDDRTNDDNPVDITTVEDAVCYYVTIDINAQYQTILGAAYVQAELTGEQITNGEYPVQSLPSDIVLAVSGTTATVVRVELGQSELTGNSTDGYTIPAGQELDNSTITITFTDAPYWDYSGMGASATEIDTDRTWQYTLSLDEAVLAPAVTLTAVGGDTISVISTNIASVVPSNDGYIHTADTTFYKPIADTDYTLTITAAAGYVLNSITWTENGADQTADNLPTTSGGSYDITVTPDTGNITAVAVLALATPSDSVILAGGTIDKNKWYTSEGDATYANIKFADVVIPNTTYESNGYTLYYAFSDSATSVTGSWSEVPTARTAAISGYGVAASASATKYIYLRYGNGTRFGTISSPITIQIDNKAPGCSTALTIGNAVRVGTDYWAKAGVTLTCSIADTDSGVDATSIKYTFTNDNTTDPADADLSAGTLSDGKLTVNYALACKSDYLYVTFKDKVGNVQKKFYSLSNIYFDKMAPAAMREGYEIHYYTTYSASTPSANVEISDLTKLADWQAQKVYIIVRPIDQADATANTTVSGIAKVVLHDGLTDRTMSGTDIAGNYVFILEDGIHAFTLEAFDHAGNSRSTASRTIKVDTTGITGAQVVLMPGQTTYKSDFNVQAVAASLSGITEVTYTYRMNGTDISGAQQVYSGTGITASGTTYTVLAVAPSTLLDQKRDLTVLVTFKDACDRTKTVESYVFSFNSKGSTITFENTANTWTNMDVTVPIRVEDISGLDSVNILVNDEPANYTLVNASVTGAEYTLTLNENSPITGTKVTVSATNKAGDTTTSEYLYRIDKQLPVISLSGINPGSKNNKDQTLTIEIDENIWNEATVTATAYRTMDGENQAVDLGTMVLTSEKYIANCIFTEEGTYTYTITVVDAAGNSSTQSIGFMIDKTAPIVVFANRENKWTNQNISVPFTVIEGLSGIRNVVVTENGTEITPSVVKKDVYEQSYVYTITNSSPATGTVIAVTATNDAGVTVTSEYIYRLDNEAPSITLSGVVNGNVYNSNQVLNIRAGDNVWQDMKPVTVTATKLLDGVTTNLDIGNFAVTDSSSLFARGFTEDGLYQVTATATDAAGNQTEQTISFTVDKTAPALSISGAPDGTYSGKPITLNFQAIESFFETDNVTISVERRYEGSNFTNRINFSNTGKSSSVSNTFSNDGEYTVTMTATDGAGNTATEQTLHFTIDVTAPVVSIMGTRDYFVTKDAVTLDFSVRETYYETNQVRITGSRRDAEGRVTNLNVEGWMNTAKNSSLMRTFSEDGYYTILLTSIDFAGNMKQEVVHFTIDTRPPVIDELEQYNGKYIKKFVFEKPLEELITELTTPTVQMTLNGSAYDGSEITKDGKYTLIISVTDEVGFVTTRTIEFMVDNTAPKVIFSGAKDNKTYSEPIHLNITLENDNDTIDSIVINGENQDVQNKTSYDYSFNSFGDYVVTVYTSDKAGNTNSQTLTFRYAEHSKNNLFWIFIGATTLAALLTIGIVIFGFRKKG